MTQHQTPDTRVQSRTPVPLQLSNEMVRLYKELFGRGPTGARTDFAGPDCVVCTLEQSLTPAERAMVELGELQRLRDVRLFFQHARENDFREAVERITGRRVRAFVSGMDVSEDVASEIFYLEPRAASPDGAAASPDGAAAEQPDAAPEGWPPAGAEDGSRLP
jgi:uncharacterized protein YbcI